MTRSVHETRQEAERWGNRERARAPGTGGRDHMEPGSHAGSTERLVLSNQMPHIICSLSGHKDTYRAGNEDKRIFRKLQVTTVVIQRKDFQNSKAANAY